MEESFDPATSTLLCQEDNNSCFDDFECSAADGSGFSPYWDHKNLNFNHQCLSEDYHGSVPFMGFLEHSDETIALMVERERAQLPKDDYLMKLRSGDLDLSVRREAIDWIWKVHDHYGFGPYTFCLSVNYLDRFLSVFELPRGKSWAVQLSAVACLSIAAKMEEAKVPQCVDLQVGEPKFIFEAKTIQRMELIVLSKLGWKMQALIPCSFVHYFLSKITCEQRPTKSSISRSVQLILSMTRCIDFLEFKPSEIAAAVAISVSVELQAKELDKALTCVVFVEKERVLKCVELIRELYLSKVSSNHGSNLVQFAPQSPVGVLDASCLSSKSDELRLGSFTNSSQYTANTKWNKSEGPSNGTCMS